MTTPPSTDEADLVAAARAGDRAALDTLLRQHQPQIHAVCRRITGNDADALDATQEAMIAIVRGLPRFDGRSRFSTWIYRIATNACLDELRRRRRRPAVGLDHHAGSDSAREAPEEVADQRSAALADAVADRLLVDAALAELPIEFRTAVVLRDLCQLDYAEIASVLDVPAGTVRSRIARGRAQLATLMTGNQTGPDDRPTPAP